MGINFLFYPFKFLTSLLKGTTEMTISIKTVGGFGADVGFSFDITNYLLEQN